MYAAVTERNQGNIGQAIEENKQIMKKKFESHAVILVCDIFMFKIVRSTRPSQCFRNDGPTANKKRNTEEEQKLESSLESVKWNDYPFQEVKIEKEIRELEQLLKCKVCLDRDSCMVFFPCRHMATCESCERNLHRCPVCRAPINESVEINENMS